MTTPLDILLGHLSDARNALEDIATFDDHDLDGRVTHWGDDIDALMGDVMRAQGERSVEAEESARDIEIDRQIDELWEDRE